MADQFPRLSWLSVRRSWLESGCAGERTGGRAVARNAGAASPAMATGGWAKEPVASGCSTGRLSLDAGEGERFPESLGMAAKAIFTSGMRNGKLKPKDETRNGAVQFLTN